MNFKQLTAYLCLFAAIPKGIEVAKTVNSGYLVEKIMSPDPGDRWCHNPSVGFNVTEIVVASYPKLMNFIKKTMKTDEAVNYLYDSLMTKFHNLRFGPDQSILEGVISENILTIFFEEFNKVGKAVGVRMTPLNTKEDTFPRKNVLVFGIYRSMEPRPSSEGLFYGLLHDDGGCTVGRRTMALLGIEVGAIERYMKNRPFNEKYFRWLIRHEACHALGLDHVDNSFRTPLVATHMALDRDEYFACLHQYRRFNFLSTEISRIGDCYQRQEAALAACASTLLPEKLTKIDVEAINEKLRRDRGEAPKSFGEISMEPIAKTISLGAILKMSLALLGTKINIASWIEKSEIVLCLLVISFISYGLHNAFTLSDSTEVLETNDNILKDPATLACVFFLGGCLGNAISSMVIPIAISS